MDHDHKDGELKPVELREGYTPPLKPLATTEQTMTTTERAPGVTTETTRQAPVTPDQQRGYVPIPKPQPRPEPK